LYFKTDSIILINTSDDQYVLQVILYGLVLGTGFLVGYAQVATEYACKKYAFQCTWKERKAQAFARRIENIIPLSGLVGLGSSGLYYWFYYNNPVPTYKFRDYSYIFLGLISISFALSLVLPRAPYSDRKVDGKKGSSRRLSCCYGWKILKPVFTMKMLINLPHIIPSASILAIYEMVCFMFLRYNTEDKTSLSPIALPLIVLGTYQLVCLLLNISRCKKCYGNRMADDTGRCCGSFTNIIMISASTALVVLGYFADNDMLFKTWPPFLKNFSLYFSVAVALAVTFTLLAKQRKSLLVTHTETYSYLLSDDKRFYDATKLV